MGRLLSVHKDIASGEAVSAVGAHGLARIRILRKFGVQNTQIPGISVNPELASRLSISIQAELPSADKYDVARFRVRQGQMQAELPTPGLRKRGIDP